MSPAPASLRLFGAPLARRLAQGALHALAALLVMGCAVTTAPAQTGSEPAEVPPPGRVGKVGLLSGDVTLIDLRSREQQPATLNWPITSGYRLSTGPMARAEVRIGSLAVRLGKRTLKFRDYGKLAATFLNLETGRAVRVVALESSRDLASLKFGHLPTKKARQMEAYLTLPDSDLFEWYEVGVDLPEQDRPGHPLSRVACEECGEGINDRREVIRDERTLCRSCADGGYFRRL